MKIVIHPQQVRILRALYLCGTSLPSDGELALMRVYTALTNATGARGFPEVLRPTSSVARRPV